jgi:hypothetical protein
MTEKRAETATPRHTSGKHRNSSSWSNMKRPLKMQEKDPLNSAFIDGGGPHRTHAVYCAANHPPRTGRATNVQGCLKDACKDEVEAWALCSPERESVELVDSHARRKRSRLFKPPPMRPAQCQSS